MNTRTGRAVARFGTAVLLVAAVVGINGSPALAAAAPNLALDVVGTTLAANAKEKVAFATITNEGAGKATDVEVVYDLSKLDQTKVKFVPVEFKGRCKASDGGDTLTCGIDDLPDGYRFDLPMVLVRQAGSGNAGQLTVTVRQSGDEADVKDNTATADVKLNGKGPDLFVFAPDVPFDMETGELTGTVPPGGTGKLYYEVANQGDVAADGVKITIKLPEHVTFTDTNSGAFDGCELKDGNTTAVCTFNDLRFIPMGEDEDDEDDVSSVYAFTHPIKVSGDAPAPSTLTEGVVTVESIIAPADRKRASPHRISLPRCAEVPDEVDEVDATDNSDEFAVHVAKAGGSGGGEGGLPITGVQIGLIGGVGLAVVIAGVVLLLVSRRRRIVVVAPQDETPTA